MFIIIIIMIIDNEDVDIDSLTNTIEGPDFPNDLGIAYKTGRGIYNNKRAKSTKSWSLFAGDLKTGSPVK